MFVSYASIFLPWLVQSLTMALGGTRVDLRKYGRLLGTTFLIGGAGGILGGFLLAWSHLTTGTIGNFFIGTLMNLLVGLTVSVLSMMGMFAYIVVNYLGITLFKSAKLWNWIQLFLIAFAAFDMVYLRYAFADGQVSMWSFIWEPLVLLIISVVVAYFKVKATNESAWVPTLFFMFVVTAIAWVPGLRENNLQSSFLMGLPLIACNAWQVLQLHNVMRKSA